MLDRLFQANPIISVLLTNEETPMKRFAKPVSIFVGLGFPRDVETVEEAFEILNEWVGSRSPAHEQVLAAVRAALTDDSVSGARLAFEAFAKKMGVLAPDALELAAARAADEWLSA
ncbi:MAG TPA: DUF982 domain-containing protein [Mesorhizobium sp.]|uniref:DUF982 domain-containing protein n=1 Tax=Mesorhizobium sp. TaxID=1871066 RepID=UPI002DDD89B2|nr:DUF982 domain-containing protein [Mesorhizobium sp.]HEV2505469.1 DUF982 domain-containing protein [Mesorhizobium sp.]